MVESGQQGPVCKYLISPGLLNRCSLYCRNEERRPEKCWHTRYNPCPNNTVYRRFRDAPTPYVVKVKPITACKLKICEDEDEAEVEYE